MERRGKIGKISEKGLKLHTPKLPGLTRKTSKQLRAPCLEGRKLTAALLLLVWFLASSQQSQRARAFGRVALPPLTSLLKNLSVHRCGHPRSRPLVMRRICRGKCDPPHVQFRKPLRV
jgi:hypothetical protein